MLEQLNSIILTGSSTGDRNVLLKQPLLFLFPLVFIKKKIDEQLDTYLYRIDLTFGKLETIFSNKLAQYKDDSKIFTPLHSLKWRRGHQRLYPMDAMCNFKKLML